MWVLIIATLASPTSFPPFGGEGPNLLGINLAVIVQGLALCGMLIGLRLAWNTTSRLVESLAYTVFTFPATMVVLFSPAIVVTYHAEPRLIASASSSPADLPISCQIAFGETWRVRLASQAVGAERAAVAMGSATLVHGRLGRSGELPGETWARSAAIRAMGTERAAVAIGSATLVHGRPGAAGVESTLL